jgi:hypothetical protein
MFQTASFVFSKISSKIIQLIRHLKALFEVELHKKRIKFSHRKIYEIICYFYFDTNSSSISKTSNKEKIKAAKSLKDSNESFSFEWIVNVFLIINFVKSLVEEIENFRKNLIFKAFQYKNRNILFVNNISTRITSKTHSTSIFFFFEDISNIDLSLNFYNSIRKKELKSHEKKLVNLDFLDAKNTFSEIESLINQSIR